MTPQRREPKKPKAPAKMGRPTKFDPAILGTVTRLCRLGATNPQIAEAIDVSEATVQRWMRSRKDFRLAVKQGKVEADMVANDNLYARCQFHRYTKTIPFKVKDVTYDQGRRLRETERVELVEVEEVLPPDTTALIFWHKNRQPAVWRDRHDLTSAGEKISAGVLAVPLPLNAAEWGTVAAAQQATVRGATTE